MIPSNYSLQKPPKNGNFSQNPKAVACRLWLCNSEIRNPNSEIGARILPTNYYLSLLL